MSALDFEAAKDWYQNRATSLDRAGVKIRLFHAYPDVADEEQAFCFAVRDEQAKTPLPA